MTKFGSLLNMSSNDNLNTTFIKTNDAPDQNQKVLSLNEFSNSQENLDYLLTVEQTQNKNENTQSYNVFNFTAQKCFLNEKLNEFRVNLKELFGFERYGLKHRPPHAKLDYNLGEFKSIHFINVYQQKFF